MNNQEDIIKIDALFDIRVETLCAALLKYAETNNLEWGIDDFVVTPLGHQRRRSQHVVKSVKLKYYEDDEALIVEVNRKGLFDTLPEGLILKLDGDYDTSIERTRDIERQIKDARSFFLPFEQAMYHPRVEIEQGEQNWTENFPDFIPRMWGLPMFGNVLTERQEFLLCYLLPEAYRVAGNWELTGLYFEAILQKPISLEFASPLEFDIPDDGTTNSDVRLGDDAVLGTSFRDDAPSLIISVRGITLDELPEYLPGGEMRLILEELLYGYFLPLDVAVITKINVTDDTWGFTFDEAYLGYNVLFN